MDLKKSREDIDCIDVKLAELLNQRMEISKEVLKYKRANGLQVIDKAREAHVLENADKLATEGFNEHMKKIFEAIIEESRAIQTRANV